MSDTTKRDRALNCYGRALEAIAETDEQTPLVCEARDLLRETITPMFKESIHRLFNSDNYESAQDLAHIVGLSLAALHINTQLSEDCVLLKRQDLDEDDQKWLP